MDSQEKVSVPESHVFVPSNTETLVENDPSVPLPIDDNPRPPIDPAKIDPKIRSNVECRKAALELLEYGALEPEFLECMNRPRFWETMKQEAEKRLAKLAPPPEKKPEPKMEPNPEPKDPDQIVPLTDDQAKEFLRELMPQGKYVDKTVAWVLGKDLEYAKEFAEKLLPFQKRMGRLLARGDKLVARKKGKKLSKSPKAKVKPVASKKKKARQK